MARRRVDDAMLHQRRQKNTVRRLWLEQVRYFQRSAETRRREPLYLTLAGSAGLDVDLLSKEGILSRTEVSGVAKNDQWKVVAVESSPDAVLELQSRVPGLKIIKGPIENLVRGEANTTWPTGGDKELCRARVVNLDLNRPLLGLQARGRIIFPTLQLITKIAELHIEGTGRSWALLLTLHGEITWDHAVSVWVQEFIDENCGREPLFAAGFVRLLGATTSNRLRSGRIKDLTTLSISDQQRVLMAFVPKQLAQLVQNQGWQMTTEWNLRYGGARHAPIVTWIISFLPRISPPMTPEASYRHNLRTIWKKAGEIATNGSIQIDA
jgi:hypothetical protein